MQFFIDTANVDEIRAANDMGVIAGVTTNPSLIAKEGRDYAETLAEIASIVDGPISGEVKATTADAAGMIEEGRAIHALDPARMVVKIPMTAEGLKAIKVLSAEGIPTNCTLIFSANQALLAARAGAAYVSPFLGRLDDISQPGIDLICTIAAIFANYPELNCKIIAASVRNPIHVTDCALAGADIATVPYKAIEQMPVYKPQVEELLAMYESMDEEDFIGDWAAVEAAAAKLQAILEDDTATQTQANAAIEEFLVAVKALQPTEAKRVKDAIASAEEVLNNVSSAAFTEESWKAAQDALQAAKDLVAAGAVTAEQADKAIADLQNAVKGLTPSDAKLALDTVIETAQGMNTEEYTTSSWKAVEDALANALAVQGSVESTTEDYTNAVTAMMDAMGGLVKRGDTASLAKFVEQAKALKEENYTPNSWKPFAEALAAAEAVLANSADASQADVDAAYAALLTAQTALVRAADKSELNAAVAEANKLNKDDYTADSWAAVAKAKEAAAAVAADANATQAEVDAARDALLKAIRELVKVAVPDTDPTTPPDDSSSGSNLPATGDSFAALAVAGLLAVSAGAAAVLNKKRKMDK